MSPYSEDLRIRILNYALNHGKSVAARIFNVSISTVARILGRYFATGSIKPKQRSYKTPRLIGGDGELFIQSLLVDKPDYTLHELTGVYNETYQAHICPATMANTLNRMGYTKKKKTFSDPKKKRTK
jgi:transposase